MTHKKAPSPAMRMAWLLSAVAESFAAAACIARVHGLGSSSWLAVALMLILQVAGFLTAFASGLYR